MGFRSSEWAYSVPDLTPPERAVLVALAHVRNDETGACFPGQETLVQMTALSEKTVRRALAVLEARGAITRTARFAGRYRTSDSYELRVDNHRSERPPVTVTTGQRDHRSESPSPPVTVSLTTGHSDRAREQEVEQEEQQEALFPPPAAREIESAFDEAYSQWPKKAQRKESLQAFIRATKKRPIDQLIADVVRHGKAYAETREKQFVPALSVWLRGERWDDELPTPPAPSDEQWNAFLAGTRTEQNMRVVAPVATQETESCHHRWMPDGTCNFCPAHRDRVGVAA